MKKKAKKLTAPLSSFLYRTFLPRDLGTLLFLFLLLFVQAPSAAVEVAIIKSRNIKPYNLAIQGFKELVPARTEEHDMDANLEKGVGIIDKVRAAKPDIILSVGGEATYVASSKIKNHPVVFSMVYDPGRYEITGENITGVTQSIPLEEQITTLKKILPEIKKVGVIFSDEELKLPLAKASTLLADGGIELITKQVHSLKDIPETLKNLVSEVDSLWLLLDSVITAFPRVVQEAILFPALKDRIPVIGFSKWSVTAGALFCFYSEPEDMGKQAGKMANRILKGANPSSIPVESPDNVRIFFNEKVMERVEERVKVEIPSSAYMWEGN